jgi:hypothetical protein
MGLVSSPPIYTLQQRKFKNVTPAAAHQDKVKKPLKVQANGEGAQRRLSKAYLKAKVSQNAQSLQRDEKKDIQEIEIRVLLIRLPKSRQIK